MAVGELADTLTHVDGKVNRAEEEVLWDLIVRESTPGRKCELVVAPVEDARETTVKVDVLVTDKGDVFINSIVVQEQATDAALELYITINVNDHLVEHELDDAISRVRYLLVVVVPESGLVGISGNNVHLKSMTRWK